MASSCKHLELVLVACSQVNNILLQSSWRFLFVVIGHESWLTVVVLCCSRDSCLGIMHVGEAGAGMRW